MFSIRLRRKPLVRRCAWLDLGYDGDEQILSESCQIDGRGRRVNTLNKECNRRVTLMSHGPGLFVGAGHQ
jgi:hypothetical protein